MDTKQKIIIFVLMLCTLMGSSLYYRNSCLPHHFRRLHATFHHYALGDPDLPPYRRGLHNPARRIGDIYGRSRMFNAGFGGFTLGSLFCGLSPCVYWPDLLPRGPGSRRGAHAGKQRCDRCRHVPARRAGTAFGDISLGYERRHARHRPWRGHHHLCGLGIHFFINIPIGIAATCSATWTLTDNPRVHARLDIPGMGLLGTALTFIVQRRGFCDRRNGAS